jgi:hypothetical protein
MTDADVRREFDVMWDGRVPPRIYVAPPLEECWRESWRVSGRAEEYGAIAAIVETALEAQAMNLAELGRATGFTPRQLQSALNRLRRAGILHVQRTERGAVGRPRAVYKVAA